MSYRVVFSPEAEEQLAALYRHIAAAVSPRIAARYTEAVVSYCESLGNFPHRGTMRDEVRPGLRVTNYKKRAVSASTWTPSRFPSSECSKAARTTKRSCKPTSTTARSTELV